MTFDRRAVQRRREAFAASEQFVARRGIHHAELHVLSNTKAIETHQLDIR